MLRTDADVAAFARDRVEARKVSWRLAPDASPDARRAWRERGSLAEVGERLRQEWFWGCIALVRLERGEPYPRVTFAAEQDGASVFIANETVPVAHGFTGAALAGVTTAVCNGHRHEAEERLSIKSLL